MVPFTTAIRINATGGPMTTTAGLLTIFLTFIAVLERTAV